MWRQTTSAMWNQKKVTPTFPGLEPASCVLCDVFERSRKSPSSLTFSQHLILSWFGVRRAHKRAGTSQDPILQRLTGGRTSAGLGWFSTPPARRERKSQPEESASMGNSIWFYSIQFHFLYLAYITVTSLFCCPDANLRHHRRPNWAERRTSMAASPSLVGWFHPICRAASAGVRPTDGQRPDLNCNQVILWEEGQLITDGLLFP